VNLALLGGSLAAVLFVAWLVRRLGLGAPTPLDEAGARRVAEETFIGQRFGAVLLDRKGTAALVDGRGAIALVRAHGDKWVARLLRPPIATRREGERLIVVPGEAMFGATVLNVGADAAARWAPRLEGRPDA
jgi:hypothetical protein